MLSNTGINKVILLGQVTNDPHSGILGKLKFSCFTIVTNEVIKKGTENTEHNEYHNIRVPEKLMEQESLQIAIGQTLYIEGKIQMSSFVDETRVKRYLSDIVANKVEIINFVMVNA
ncbi:single-stranded DNA-binding protein [Mucilaginibacter glaciei]|uniref:Single-stranded DNA-binding protein n=1 Tax=Mucilaginibacter glaciei TaxID=2772109 RepID=A0A926NUV5_9SPHI|nr:single-stranded DNA-binding protein [Mucilaginibacter glaciei]MBD1394455.1 single-stranded DNA-binding protein [Mucilaginibacter glaciei]